MFSIILLSNSFGCTLVPMQWQNKKIRFAWCSLKGVSSSTWNLIEFSMKVSKSKFVANNIFQLKESRQSYTIYRVAALLIIYVAFKTHFLLI